MRALFRRPAARVAAAYLLFAGALILIGNIASALASAAAVNPSIPAGAVSWALALLGAPGLYIFVRREWERRERASKSARAVLEAAWQNLQDAALVVDLATGSILSANPAAERMFGCSRKELLASDLERFHARHSDLFEAFGEEGGVEAGRVIRSSGHDLRRRDGTLFPCQIRMSCLSEESDGDSGPAVAVQLIRDLSPVREAEALLARREVQFRTLISKISDVVLIVDDEGSIRFESPSLERLLGARAMPRTGRSLFEFVHPEDRDSLADAIAPREEAMVEKSRDAFRLRHDDGSWRDLEAVGRERLKDGAEIDGMVLVLRDVTAQREAEKALAACTRKYERVFRSSPVAIAIATRPKDRLLEVNAAFAELFGYRPEDMVGRSGLELGLWANPDDRRRLARHTRETGTTRGIELRMRTKSGRIRDVLLFCERLELDGKSCLLVCCHEAASARGAASERSKAELRRTLSVERGGG